MIISTLIQQVLRRSKTLQQHIAIRFSTANLLCWLTTSFLLKKHLLEYCNIYFSSVILLTLFCFSLAFLPMHHLRSSTAVTASRTLWRWSWELAPSRGPSRISWQSVGQLMTLPSFSAGTELFIIFFSL